MAGGEGCSTPAAATVNQELAPTPRDSTDDSDEPTSADSGPSIAACRRPISPAEYAYLVTSGAELRRLREAAGMSRRSLANAGQLGERSLQRIEAGQRRTRRSTLARLVAAIVTASPGLGDPENLLDHLCAAAGPALAPESAYADRVDRRRARRYRSPANKAAWADRATRMAAFPGHRNVVTDAKVAADADDPAAFARLLAELEGLGR
ncbi:MAG TPA: helix-turn-helix domain-containing protein [Acidimicrobiales bacterium]|nr:helix-turn-helix domain-containing protein [Acidimicrobiales bacterium]